MVDLSRFTLEGKVALITGGSRGIGRATAIGFVKAGASVAITSRKQPDLDIVADEIRQMGGKALPVAAHGGRMENLNKLVDTVLAEYGKLDILVNNAGTTPAMASVLDTEERLWDTIINLNLKGLYFLSQAAARVMKDAGGGAIINVASSDGFRASHGRSVYSISKAAVMMVTKAFAGELAQYNIRVNCIAPGAVDTKLLNNIWINLPEEQQENIKKQMAERIPLGHMGQPDEMVGAMIYFASDAASYLTGQTLLLDGGGSVASGAGPAG
jgi:NAD(P)-dependent dehydrogenase (short-subunit alcohol dehydrogenase family)